MHLRFLFGIVLAGIPILAIAGDQAPAHLSYVQGATNIRPGGDWQQVMAGLNAPLFPGDALTTAGSGRAEVQFDDIAVLRLAGNARVRFANLDPANRLIQLGGGTIELSLLRDIRWYEEIDGPSAAIRVLQSGRYRITLATNGDMFITVRSGYADVLFPNGSQRLVPGATLVVRDSYEHPWYRSTGAIAYDWFDRFSEDRDRELVAQLNASWIWRIAHNWQWTNYDRDDRYNRDYRGNYQSGDANYQHHNWNQPPSHNYQRPTPPPSNNGGGWAHHTEPVATSPPHEPQVPHYQPSPTPAPVATPEQQRTPEPTSTPAPTSPPWGASGLGAPPTHPN